MKKIFYIVSALLIIMVFIISGCSKETVEITLSPSQILDKSYESMQAINSFHFILNHENGSTPISMGVEMTKAEGDIVKPDKLKATILGMAMGTSLEVNLITADGKTLITNPLSGKWEKIPDQFKVLSVFDPSTGIASIIKNISSPSALNDEQVKDTICYHLKGSIESESLSSLIGSASEGIMVDAEIWIDKDDLLVRQVKILSKITANEKDGIIRTLIFTNYNQEVSITLPE